MVLCARQSSCRSSGSSWELQRLAPRWTCVPLNGNALKLAMLPKYHVMQRKAWAAWRGQGSVPALALSIHKVLVLSMFSKFGGQGSVAEPFQKLLPGRLTGGTMLRFNGKQTCMYN